MPRKQAGQTKRRFDTRLTLNDIVRILNLTPREKVNFMRNLKEKQKLKKNEVLQEYKAYEGGGQ